MLTPAEDTGLGIKVKIPSDAVDEIRSDTKSLMIRKGEIREGRLCEKSSKRRPYNWPIIEGSEKFAQNAIRQNDDLSCVLAIGEMLTEGVYKEEALIKKLGAPCSLSILAKEIGKPWIYELKDEIDLHATLQKGSFGTELLENAYHPHLEQRLHTVVVDELITIDSLCIRDPWEGTSYEMLLQNFVKVWTGKQFLETTNSKFLKAVP